MDIKNFVSVNTFPLSSHGSIIAEIFGFIDSITTKSHQSANMLDLETSVGQISNSYIKV